MNYENTKLTTIGIRTTISYDGILWTHQSTMDIRNGISRMVCNEERK